jgi:membrane protein implicated in regulation of membrane protease activity
MLPFNNVGGIMTTWYYWLMMGILLIIIEIFTPGFVIASFGIGCLVATVASFIGLNIYWQILCFCLGTLLVFYGIRPFYKKHVLPEKNQTPTNVEALKGQTARVLDTINPEQGSGRIMVGGEDWRALSDDGGIINAGESVEILRIEGATVYVRKTKT